jgi:hypothetical protein
MNRKHPCRIGLFGLVLASAGSLAVLADDSAAAIAAGGLVPRHETRIVMAREVLRISPKKVVVDYDFRNDTDEDVTTEVAFPVPAYENERAEGDVAEQSFKSFRLWVDEKPASFESESTATLKGKDVTAILRANRIDIPTLGHLVEVMDGQHLEQMITRDFEKLPKPPKARLVKAGLFDKDGSGFALWTVHLQYHWTQTFPAHSTVHIRHEYAPAVGFSELPVNALQGPAHPAINQKVPFKWTGNSVPELVASFCPEPEFLHELTSRISRNPDPEERGAIYPYWVDFILTTANTWQQPIGDFTLIIERPAPEDGKQRWISFCAPEDGKVERLDADHFQVHLTNFVPTSELHIGFFDVPLAKTEPKK